MLPIEKQVEEIKGWLEQMAAQLPGADNQIKTHPTEQQAQATPAVLVV